MDIWRPVHPRDLFPAPVSQFGMEFKQERSAIARTRRRADMITGGLSRRVTRLAKSLKAANPTHVITQSAAAIFPSVSTTGTLVVMPAPIVQGDNYSDRFGNHVDVLRLKANFTFVGGTTAVTNAPTRVTIGIVPYNTVFAANMVSDYNPIINNAFSRLIYDKFIQVGLSH